MANRTYQLNENIFSEDLNEQSAYILGLLYADGHNRIPYQVVLFLKEDDVDILNKVKKIIFVTDKQLEFRKGKNGIIKGKKYKFKNSYGLSINSKKISSDLAKLGCNKDKTVRCRLPELDSDMFRHFVRGYFDGDGSFSFNTYDVIRGRVAICCTKDFATSLSIKLNTILNIRTKIKNLPDTNKIVQIVLQGNKQVIKFLDWMYLDSNIRLDRKYGKYQEFKKQYV